ncbi:MAG: tol-pal system protein YbgF [Deltaproteobacteria bacterium]|nr:tol-pal system protein YbgF [Deltaproteobacteria bacterium]
MTKELFSIMSRSNRNPDGSKRRRQEKVFIRPTFAIVCLVLLAAGCAGKPGVGQEWRMQNLESGMVRSQDRNTALEQEIQALSFRVERLEGRLNQFQLAQADGIVEENLSVEAGVAATPAPDPEPAVVPERTPAMDRSAPEPARPRPGADPAGPEALYQRALDTLMAGKPVQARELFTAFGKQYPSNALIPNSMYWIGECHYSEKRYAQAILSLKEVVRLYPRHPKAPDALLKTIYAYRNLNDRENADFYRKVLLEDYPDSNAAGMIRRESGGRS